MKKYDTASYELIVLDHSELNYQEISHLETYIDTLLHENKTRIIIDFSKVDHVTSIGMGGLITILQKIQEQKGDLKLINVHKIYDMLKTGGLDRVIETHSKMQ